MSALVTVLMVAFTMTRGVMLLRGLILANEDVECSKGCGHDREAVVEMDLISSGFGCLISSHLLLPVCLKLAKRCQLREWVYTTSSTNHDLWTDLSDILDYGPPLPLPREHC
jgi:hypothetical protein